MSQTMDNLKAEIATRFPTSKSGGGSIIVCRKISGSKTWSQHAWGNALDVFASKSVGDQIFRWVKANQVRLGTGLVLWQVKNHFDHLHIEGAFKKYGTPPCAGGPSVAEVILGGGFLGEDTAVGAAIETVIGPFDFLAALGEPTTYLRVLWAIGGAAAVGYGVVLGFATFSNIDLVSIAKKVATKGAA